MLQARSDINLRALAVTLVIVTGLTISGFGLASISEPVSAATSTTVSLQPSSQSVGPDATVTYSIVLESADNGIGAFDDINVTVNDTGVASITGISSSISENAQTHVRDDGSEASVNLPFGGDTADTGEVIIANVTIQSHSVGSVNLNLNVTGDIADEQGLLYTISSENGASLTVSDSNLPPIADAGPDKTVTESEIISLNGTNSTDPDEDQLSYSWEQTSGPTVDLINDKTATPRFVAPIIDERLELSFELTVSDGNQTDTDIVNITVTRAGVLIVNKSNPSAYQSIQNAVDNTSAGDTVIVRPENYREEVTLDKNISLTAPEGAILNGTALSGDPIAFDIPRNSPAAPTISGFRITGYYYGIRAPDTTGDWTIRDIEIIDSAEAGVLATLASGDWLLDNVTVRGTSEPGVTAAITAVSTSGDWGIRNATIVNNSDFAITARRSSGNWTVEDTHIASNGQVGLRSRYSTGDWRLLNSTIRNNSLNGVGARHTTGDWVIRNSTIESNAESGIDATNTSGDWTIDHSYVINNSNHGILESRSKKQWDIHYSVILGNGLEGLLAESIGPKGNATLNYWGASNGPSGDFDGSGEAVSGNVTVHPFYKDANLTSLSTTGGPPAINDFDNPPKDPDDDGVYEDINGNGAVNVVDVQALFVHLHSDTVQNNPDAFDFNDDDEINVIDVQALFVELSA